MIAPSALLADALSTALFVMGPDRAREYAEAHPEFGVLLIEPSRQAGGFAVRVLNLPEDRLSFLDLP